MFERKEIKFPTLDGLQLAGTLYLAENDHGQQTPGVVMAPGFNCTKDMFIPEAASAFQKLGITALAFDPRTIGLSEGQPRNDIDPAALASDYSDALTYLSSVQSIDADRLVIWGFSFSGAVALCAAALDPRATCVIVACPLVDLSYTHLPTVLDRAAQDRESRLLEGNPPFYLPLLTDDGENPVGFGVGLSKEDYALMLNAKRTIAPTFENRTTIQSYYRLAMWQPFTLWELLSEDTPLLWLIPELDELSPAALQRARFDRITADNKQVHIVPGKGHMDVLSGESVEELFRLQVQFIEKHAKKD